jgi:cardiolipin synthase
VFWAASNGHRCSRSLKNRLSLAGLLCATVVSGLGCASLSGEKRIAEPLQTDYSVRDAEFVHSMSQLLGAPLVEGNSVTELVNGREIFPAMLEAIRSAQRTITLESYIWSPGEVSSQLVEALSERARAGVKVSIVMDGLGSIKLTNADLQPLIEAGAQIERYNPPPWFLRIFRATHRTHRKLTVVDGRIGFTGGVCLADEWMGDAESAEQWRDTHFRLEGPVVGQMQSVFADNWLQTRSEVLHGEEYFPEPKRSGSLAAQCFRSGPTEGGEKARLSYLLAIAAARKHIRLAHAYFLPSDLAIETLLDARRRGVKIEVIVPSRTDTAVVGQAARSRWGKLLEAGVEFYEWQPSLYHCKVMIVDDIWVTAGSVNFDEQSFRTNDEANFNVLDEEFAAKLIKTFEEDKAKSRRLEPEDFKERSFLMKGWEKFVGLFRSQL